MGEFDLFYNLKCIAKNIAPIVHMFIFSILHNQTFYQTLFFVKIFTKRKLVEPVESLDVISKLNSIGYAGA